MIDQLDERRAQVYIESLIVEVTGDNAANVGFQWQGLLASGNRNNGIVAGTNFGSTGNLLNITQAQLGASAGTPAGRRATGISLGEGLNIGLVHNFFGTYGLAAIASCCRARPTPTSPRRRTSSRSTTRKRRSSSAATCRS